MIEYITTTWKNWFGSRQYQCPDCGSATSHIGKDKKRHITLFNAGHVLSCLVCGTFFDRRLWRVYGSVECKACS